MPGVDAGGFVRHLERLPADSACPTPSCAAPGGAASAAVSRISGRRRRHPTAACVRHRRLPRARRHATVHVHHVPGGHHHVKSKTAHGAEMGHLEAPKPESIAELLRSAAILRSTMLWELGSKATQNQWPRSYTASSGIPTLRSASESAARPTPCCSAARRNGPGTQPRLHQVVRSPIIYGPLVRRGGLLMRATVRPAAIDVLFGT